MGSREPGSGWVEARSGSGAPSSFPGVPAKTVVVVQAVSCREEMTQRLIHRGPEISFQLSYSLQMWRLRAVTLPPRSLCSDLLSGVGNLSTGAHLGPGPSPLPCVTGLGRGLSLACQGGVRVWRNRLHPSFLRRALRQGGTWLPRDGPARPFLPCPGAQETLSPLCP